MEMSEKKGGGAAPGLSPTASAGLCHPGCLHSSEHDLQCTHPSTYVTGHRSHAGCSGPGLQLLQQFMAPVHISGLKDYLPVQSIKTPFLGKLVQMLGNVKNEARFLIYLPNLGYLVTANPSRKNSCKGCESTENLVGAS